MARRSQRLILSGLFGLAGLGLFSPAQADFADSLFQRLKTIGAGINPDQVEMAQYSIYHPGDSIKIYSHAAAQDYPFFALVGAVKAAKGKTLPGIGTFDETKCQTPILLIDSVFSKSSNMIDDGAGKSKTNVYMATASNLASQYAKANTAVAKQQIQAQLNAQIPYFSEISTICSFGFETNFQSERNLQSVVTEGAKHIRNAYYDFKSGSLVSGVSELSAAGLENDVACDIIDEAATGGQINDIPGLKSLAGGFCKGFAGTVIDGVGGVVKGGAKVIGGVAKGAYCAVASLFGSGCSSAPPPPTAMSEAGKYCSALGGLKMVSSKTNQPTDYILQCNDATACIVKPGETPKCETGSEKIARIQAQRKKNEADFKTRVPQWAADYEAKWIPQCADNGCVIYIKVVKFNTVKTMNDNHAMDPDYPFAFTGLDQIKADQDAQAEVDKSIQRKNSKIKVPVSGVFGGPNPANGNMITYVCADGSTQTLPYPQKPPANKKCTQKILPNGAPNPPADNR